MWPPSLTFFKSILNRAVRLVDDATRTVHIPSTSRCCGQSTKRSAFIFCAEGKLCFNYITEFQKFRPRCGDPAIECECRRFTSLGCTARAYSLLHSLLDNAQSELYHSPIFNFFLFLRLFLRLLVLFDNVRVRSTELELSQLHWTHFSWWLAENFEFLLQPTVFDSCAL